MYGCMTMLVWQHFSAAEHTWLLAVRSGLHAFSNLPAAPPSLNKAACFALSDQDLTDQTGRVVACDFQPFQTDIEESCHQSTNLSRGGLLCKSDNLQRFAAKSCELCLQTVGPTLATFHGAGRLLSSQRRVYHTCRSATVYQGGLRSKSVRGQSRKTLQSEACHHARSRLST